MDGLLIFNIVLTALFVFLIANDLRWVARVARHQRDQVGWVDDIGWILVGTTSAAIFITSIWVVNTIVMLIGFALVLSTRKPRREAVQRAFTAQRQRDADQDPAPEPNRTTDHTEEQDSPR